MKTLWLHGMGASPNEEKIAFMETKGFEMNALHLDYNKEPKRYEILRDHCVANQIQFLTGSSYGGYLSFWISEELGLPCLLLNPAVSIRAKKKTMPNSVTALKSPLCLTALGAKDTIIDSQRTKLFMEQDVRPDKIIKIKTWTHEGHGFSMKAFEEIIDWALVELKAIYGN